MSYEYCRNKLEKLRVKTGNLGLQKNQPGQTAGVLPVQRAVQSLFYIEKQITKDDKQENE